MRFVLFMIPRVYQPDKPPGQRAGEGFTPPAEAVAKMMKYNEELAKAGLLLSLDGLKPLISGARVAFSDDKPTVTDGPFVESKEVVGGFWMIQAKSKEEAIEWVKRCPAAEGKPPLPRDPGRKERPRRMDQPSRGLHLQFRLQRDPLGSRKSTTASRQDQSPLE